jgi:class 3 adenylate cyclase/Tfp pilus assembly protein PilF
MQALRKITLDVYLYRDPDTAFFFAGLLYDFARERGHQMEMADALNLQGISYYIRSDYDRALDYYKRSLMLREAIPDPQGTSRALTNIGMIYAHQGKNDLALEYYQRSLQILREISDKKVMASVLSNIGRVYKNVGNYPLALDYYQRSYEISEEINDIKGMAGVLNNQGSIYMNQGFNTKALDHYLRSYKIREEIADKRGMSAALNNIGLIYMNQGFYDEALEYFEQSFVVKEEISDKRGMAITLNNIGLIHKRQHDYDKALAYYQRSLSIREEIADKMGIAGTLNNIGEIHMDLGDFVEANEYFQRSIAISEDILDRRALAITLNNMGNLSIHQADYREALRHCDKALKLSEEVKLLWVQKNACQCLYNAHKELGKTKKALTYFERTSMLEDSLKAEETNRKLRQMEFARQMLEDSLVREQEKIHAQMAYQAEVRKKNRIKNIILLVALFLVLVVAGIFRRAVYMRKAKRVIEKEKNRSENLLLNILPSEIAEELKETGSANARSFDNVSVLFTDFKNFTQISQRLSAERLVSEINACFKEFDAICARNGIEKIKTIGDSYMAAGGLPAPSDNAVKNTILAGLEMAEFVLSESKRRKFDKMDIGIEMRVGIHTGPVVAGIVGATKFQYDIWGDTVNTASRMESAGEVGKVNISQATYEFIKNDPSFRFHERGSVQAKGKGKIAMWFVEKAKV